MSELLSLIARFFLEIFLKFFFTLLFALLNRIKLWNIWLGAMILALAIYVWVFHPYDALQTASRTSLMVTFAKAIGLCAFIASVVTLLLAVERTECNDKATKPTTPSASYADRSAIDKSALKTLAGSPLAPSEPQAPNSISPAAFKAARRRSRARF